MENGRFKRISVPAAGKFLGTVTNFAPKGLGAGEWLLNSVQCRTANGRQMFIGPYAQFTVRPGEIIDAGFLKIDFEREEWPKRLFTAGGSIRLSVLPTPEFRLEELRKRVPRVIGLVKKQPMVLTGPPEQKVKPKSPFS
jgi:hypothetical protein